MSDKQTASNWKRWVIGAVVTAVAVIGVVGGAYWALADLWDSASPEKAEFAAYLIGVALLVCQIVVSGFRAAATDKTARAMQQTADSTAKGNVAERFKNAVEHLGHKSVSVRLGGVYALHHIADEEESYRERVFEILCGYIRQTTTDKERYKPHVIDGLQIMYPSVEIGSVLKLLFSSKTGKKIYSGFEAQLMSSNLEGAHLGGAILCGADLIKTIMENALLDLADLNGAGLIGAKMENASVERANMAYARLQGADLTGIDFEAVNLQGARFDKADCQHCNFLSAVNLTAEQLLNVYSLHGAQLPKDIKKQIEAKNSGLFNPPTAKKQT